MTAGDRQSNAHADYGYQSAQRWDNEYLVKPLYRIIDNLHLSDRRLFEVGFGNGWIANSLSQRGYIVTGIEPSASGVQIAQKAYPDLNLQQGNAYDDLQAEYGVFPAVYSIEVIEHCQFPRRFLSTIYNLLEPAGTAIISTPYHGYIKNLVIALSGKTDAHFNPLWDEGHLRFFSEKTLASLLFDAQFKSVNILKTGRFAPVYKSMVAVAKK